MKRSEGEKSKRLSVRLTPEEWDFIRRQAEESGMVLSDFVRSRMLVPVRNKKKEYREVATQIARLGNNVNQIARWANSHKSTANGQLVIMLARLNMLLAAVIDELRKIRARIKGE
jgi:hypothetical protein